MRTLLALISLSVPASAQVSAPPATTSFAYAFLLPPFLIVRNWTFVQPGGMTAAANAGALSVKLGGQDGDGPQDAVTLYSRLGALGWELVSCSRDDQDAAPGFGQPGCIFKKRL